MRHSLNHSKIKPYQSKYQGQSQRGGVKFFDNHKNLNSPEFAMTVDTATSSSITPKEAFLKSQERPQNKLNDDTFSSLKTQEKGISAFNEDLKKLKEKLRMKDIELELLKKEEKRSQLKQENLPKLERFAEAGQKNTTEVERNFDSFLKKSPKKLIDLDRSFDVVLNSKKVPDLDKSLDEKRIRINRSVTPVSTNILGGHNTPTKTQNDLLALAWHPVFRQPKFTKSNPKVHASNPITGYTPENYYRESPTARRGMAEYGNNIVGNASTLQMKGQFV
ncbi:unnamed protein product [Blepharisma stoltei]|uniref:Uncharacterized protein n=1 Tax=Blepharisma stoltei TaxID=1481888 RepID=A0AAU9J3C5_9CILI|nr:unnamed protein product [Blepharisma stoltei]